MRGLSRRRIAVGLVLAVLLPTAGAMGASVLHTQRLRSSFDRQFWDRVRYPDAQLLGSWESFGRLDGGAEWHCDFAAQGVYGTDAEYEDVEDHYAARPLVVGESAPLALNVQPVSDRALSSEATRAIDPDAVTRDVLIRTRTDIARARAFRTVYTVQALSWGHAAWLDWRCR